MVYKGNDLLKQAIANLRKAVIDRAVARHLGDEEARAAADSRVREAETAVDLLMQKPKPDTEETR